MCTITLSYDQNNALARRKLAALLSTGVFVKNSQDDADEVSLKEQQKNETKAFFEASKKSMSTIIARYL